MWLRRNLKEMITTTIVTLTSRCKTAVSHRLCRDKDEVWLGTSVRQSTSHCPLRKTTWRRVTSVQFHLLAATVIDSAHVTFQATGFRNTNFLYVLNDNGRCGASRCYPSEVVVLPTLNQLFYVLVCRRRTSSKWTHNCNDAFAHGLFSSRIWDER
jgi:hypothetical protein